MGKLFVDVFGEVDFSVVIYVYYVENVECFFVDEFVDVLDGEGLVVI